jgi:hypothetical protein
MYNTPHTHERAFKDEGNTLETLFDRMKGSASTFKVWEQLLHKFANSSQFWLVRGGDIIHDFKSVINKSVGGPKIMPSAANSILNFIEHEAPAKLRDKLERLTHGSDIVIRDEIFPLRKNKFIPETISISNKEGLRSLTERLKSFGVQHIYLDAQFGNMFRDGVGRGMTFVFSTASQLDGATKISPDKLTRYDIDSKFDFKTFNVPFFTQKENDTVNLTMKFYPGPNVKEIDITHVNDSEEIIKQCNLRTSNCFTIENLKRCVGLAPQDPVRPINISEGHPPYDWRNHEIITMKAATDWSQLIYTLLLNNCGMKTVFVTNDNICLAQAAILGVPYVLFSRTMGDDEEVIEFYIFDERQTSLTPDQSEKIKEILREPLSSELIASFASPFNDAVERFKANMILPGRDARKKRGVISSDTLIPQSLLNEFDRIVKLNYNDVYSLIEIFGKEPDDPTINRFQSLIFTTKEEFFTLMFKQKMSEVYKLFKPLVAFYSKLFIQQADGISNIIYQLNKIYGYKRDKIIEAERDSFVISILNGVYIPFGEWSLHSLNGITGGFPKLKELVKQINPRIVGGLTDRGKKCHDFHLRFEQLLWVFFHPFFRIKDLSKDILERYEPVGISSHSVNLAGDIGTTFWGEDPVFPFGGLPVPSGRFLGPSGVAGVPSRPLGLPEIGDALYNAPGVAGVPLGHGGPREEDFNRSGVAGVPSGHGGPREEDFNLDDLGSKLERMAKITGPAELAQKDAELKAAWKRQQQEEAQARLEKARVKLQAEAAAERAAERAAAEAAAREQAAAEAAAEAAERAAAAERARVQAAEQAAKEQAAKEQANYEYLVSKMKYTSLYDGRREFAPVPLTAREQAAIRQLPPKSLRRRDRPSIHQPFKSRAAAAGKRLSLINKHRFTKKRGIANAVGFRQAVAPPPPQAPVRNEEDDLADLMGAIQLSGGGPSQHSKTPGTFPLFSSDLAMFKQAIGDLRKGGYKGMPFKPSVSNDLEAILEKTPASTSAIPDYLSKVFWALKSDAEESNVLTEFYLEGYDLNDLIEQFKRGEISPAALRDQFFFLFFKHPVSSMLLECISEARLLKLVDLAEALGGEIPSNVRALHAKRFAARRSLKKVSSKQGATEMRTLRRKKSKKSQKSQKSQSKSKSKQPVFIYTDGTRAN